GLPVTGWTNLQFNVSATTSNTVFMLGYINLANYFGLDDVGMTPVPTAASILMQPVSQAVSVQSNVTFSVLAGPVPLNFQWSHNGTKLVDNGRVTGSQGSALA